MGKRMVAGLLLAFSISASASAPGDDVIERILEVSGMQGYLSGLPAQIVANAQKSVDAGAMPESFRENLAKIYSRSYPNGLFIDEVTEALRADYDRTRYEHLLKMFSSPLVKKMTSLESRPMAAEDLRKFIAGLSANPPSPERMALIRRMDSVTQTSTMIARVELSSTDSNALLKYGVCGSDTDQAKQEIEQKKMEIMKSARQAAASILLYAYRDATDSELENYLAICEDGGNRKIWEVMQNAVQDAFTKAGRQEISDLRQYLESSSPGNPKFATPCGKDSEMVVRSVSEPKIVPEPKIAPVVHQVRHRARDLRKCLDLGNDESIIRCAERGRK